MNHLAYVDLSNLFIEGQKVSAVAKGMARSLENAKQRGVIDFEYRLELYRLMSQFERRKGSTMERGFMGKAHRVDASLITDLRRDTYRFGDPQRNCIKPLASDCECRSAKSEPPSSTQSSPSGADG